MVGKGLTLRATVTFFLSAHLRESVNSVGVVKTMCKLAAGLYLEYHTIAIEIDYTSME